MNELRGNARRSPAEESPVFIVGLPRSGTSILFRALMQLPAFATRVEDVAESGIMQFANRAHELAADGGDFGPFAFMLRDTAEFERFLEAIGPQRRRHRRLQRLLGRRGAQALARSAFGWRAGGNDRVLRAFVRHAAAARGAARLVEKTPTDVRFAGRMLAAFAAARAICIVRHPVDTFASYRRRLERENAAWLRITPPEFALGWRRDAGRAHALARSAPAFTVSRYEEFRRRRRASSSGCARSSASRSSPRPWRAWRGRSASRRRIPGCSAPSSRANGTGATA
ncbi:MAG: sulfotransferase [Planctomycetota bacterium]